MSLSDKIRPKGNKIKDGWFFAEDVREAVINMKSRFNFMSLEEWQNFDEQKFINEIFGEILTSNVQKTSQEEGK